MAAASPLAADRISAFLAPGDPNGTSPARSPHGTGVSLRVGARNNNLEVMTAAPAAPAPTSPSPVRIAVPNAAMFTTKVGDSASPKPSAAWARLRGPSDSARKLQRAVHKAVALGRLSKKQARKNYQREFGTAGLSLSLAKKRNALALAVPDDASVASGPHPVLPASSVPYALPRGSSSKRLVERVGASTPDVTGPQRRLLRAGSRVTMVPDYTQPDSTSFRRSTSAKAYYLLEELFTRPRGKTCGLVSFAILQVVLGAVLLTFGDVGNGHGTDFMTSLWQSWTYVAGEGVWEVLFLSFP